MLETVAKLEALGRKIFEEKEEYKQRLRWKKIEATGKVKLFYQFA